MEDKDKDRQLDPSSPFYIKFIDDDRELIVEDGDENTAFLPRFILQPFRGLSSGLEKKS